VFETISRVVLPCPNREGAPSPRRRAERWLRGADRQPLGAGLDRLLAVAEHFKRPLWFRRRLADMSQESLVLPIDVHRTDISQ
jgi:hypothetical protein